MGNKGHFSGWDSSRNPLTESAARRHRPRAGAALERARELAGPHAFVYSFSGLRRHQMPTAPAGYSSSRSATTSSGPACRGAVLPARQSLRRRPAGRGSRQTGNAQCPWHANTGKESRPLHPARRASPPRPHLHRRALLVQLAQSLAALRQHGAVLLHDAPHIIRPAGREKGQQRGAV